jgi:aspartate/methionine/tyrosine aminotransferase
MPVISPHASIVRPGVFALLEAKIQARARAGAVTIPLHIGDTYLKPHASARIDAFNETASSYPYGPTAGLPALREALASARGFALDPEHEVHIAAGATHALFCAARALLGHGDEVLVLTPYWPLTPGVFHAAGAMPIEVALSTRLQCGETLNLEAELAAHLTERTKALYLATPNNPDGFVWQPADLAGLYAFAERHDLWIFSDEVYADYVYEGTHTSMLALDPARVRTLAFGSFSKSHALAGYRVGYSFGPREVVARARRVSTHSGFNVPVLLQEACTQALLNGHEWLTHAHGAYRGARHASRAALIAAGHRVLSGQGGTYHFVDLAPVLRGRPLNDFLEHALNAGVLVAPGSSSGAAYAEWVRICFTSVPEATLLDGVTLFVGAAAQF